MVDFDVVNEARLRDHDQYRALRLTGDTFLRRSWLPRL